jgi:hypothetical protein
MQKRSRLFTNFVFVRIAEFTALWDWAEKHGIIQKAG